jgi:hypothetical protein
VGADDEIKEVKPAVNVCPQLPPLLPSSLPRPQDTPVISQHSSDNTFIPETPRKQQSQQQTTTSNSMLSGLKRLRLQKRKSWTAADAAPTNPVAETLKGVSSKASITLTKCQSSVSNSWLKRYAGERLHSRRCKGSTRDKKDVARKSSMCDNVIEQDCSESTQRLLSPASVIVSEQRHSSENAQMDELGGSEIQPVNDMEHSMRQLA